jgi:hypothetical protein
MPGRRGALLTALLLLATVAALCAPQPTLAADPDSPADEVRLPAAATAITPGSVNRTSVDLTASYDVDLAVRSGDRAVRMDTTATITNTSGGSIDRLELNTVVARLGDLRLYRVSVDNRTLFPATGSAVRIDDQTLIVPLGGVLLPGATTRVRVIYHATLRTTTAGSDWFFTRANGIVELYRAIPWISLERPFERTNHGDPFITPTASRVTLKLTTDRVMTVALNATRTSVSANGRVQEFVATNVRDLPLAMAPDFRVSTTTVGDTLIRVYARPGAPAAGLLSQARLAIQRIERLVLPYPWPVYTVVESAGGYAMEGPGTAWIPRGIDRARLPYLLAHETAHQWLPGLVGNDQWAEPFADEAVADMIARTTLNERRAPRCAENRLDLDITRYTGACYYEVVYIQGGNWLNDLRRRMGDDAFWGALRDYLDDRRFGLGSIRELLDTFDAATPLDLRERAQPFFPGVY